MAARSGYSKTPAADMKKIAEDMKRLVADAATRMIEEVQHEDTDRIVKLLGGAFTVREEWSTYGGNKTTVLEGANRCEAVILSTKGVVTDKVRVYAPRVRSVS